VLTSSQLSHYMKYDTNKLDLLSTVVFCAAFCARSLGAGYFTVCHLLLAVNVLACAFRLLLTVSIFFPKVSIHVIMLKRMLAEDVGASRAAQHSLERLRPAQCSLERCKTVSWCSELL
jgi:hypothetical protein